MPGASNSRDLDATYSQTLNQAFAELLQAVKYAVDTNSRRWDFAVSISRLERIGVTESDARWLVRKGFVEHAQEVTALGEDGRQFTPTGELTFTPKTCFVLTEAGLQESRRLSNTRAAERTDVVHEDNGQAEKRPVVRWDSESRKLYVDGVLSKRFKWPAVNQETILGVFQEEGWPDRIDDPLPPQHDQDSKRRLSDTIKCLNRKHSDQLIRFHGDGTGEGIMWELIASNDPDAGSRIR